METATPAHNPILSCCEPLIALTAPLKDDRRAPAVAADLREQIQAAFVAMEKAAFEHQIGMVAFKDAKYAMVSYIDEVVLTSTWPGRLEWMSRPLQLEYFGEHTAGEVFFDRLANLRQGGEENLHLLELYYYCLQLGFEGFYRIKGLEHLMALQVDLRGQIDTYRGPVKSALSPAGLPEHLLLHQVRRDMPYWVIAVIAMAAIFFTYMGYAVTSGNMAESRVAAVLESRHKLPQ